MAAIKDMFTASGAPTTLRGAGMKADDRALDDLAKTAVRLGPVGTVFSIDERLAKYIFHKANN